MPPTLPDPPVGDPRLDDWFAEQGEVDWSDEQKAAPARPSTGAELRSTARAAPAGAVFASEKARRLAAVRRRRLIGLGVLLALALLGVAVGIAAFGGDESAAPTTAPAVTTQAPPADPPPAATQPPAATTQPPGETTSPLTVELPASGSLAVGARGEEVETLQTALRALDFDPGDVDGEFGEATREAVRGFQRANDLPADGIVGPTTAETLNAVLAEQGVTG